MRVCLGAWKSVYSSQNETRFRLLASRSCFHRAELIRPSLSLPSLITNSSRTLKKRYWGLLRTFLRLLSSTMPGPRSSITYIDNWFPCLLSWLINVTLQSSRLQTAREGKRFKACLLMERSIAEQQSISRFEHSQSLPVPDWTCLPMLSYSTARLVGTWESPTRACSLATN